MSEQLPRDRLIGLQACAKAIHEAGEPVEETARKAIALYDLLRANSVKPGVLPTEQALKYGEPMTPKERQGIAELIRAHSIDLHRFEQWVGEFFPEVKDWGLSGLTREHAGHILGRAEQCLKAFRDYERTKRGGDPGLPSPKTDGGKH